MTESPELNILIGIGILISVAFFVIWYNSIIGSVTLTLQTMIHRRNILFIAVLSLLMEMFNFSPVFSFIDFHESQELTLLPILKGGLVFFSIYSLIEYVYCLYSDIVFSAPRLSKSSHKIRHAVLTAPIGLFRTAFDIIIPLAACAFVFFLYKPELIQFSHKASDFFTTYIEQRSEEYPQYHDQLAYIKSTIEELDKLLPNQVQMESESPSDKNDGTLSLQPSPPDQSSKSQLDNVENVESFNPNKSNGQSIIQ